MPDIDGTINIDAKIKTEGMNKALEKTDTAAKLGLGDIADQFKALQEGAANLKKSVEANSASMASQGGTMLAVFGGVGLVLGIVIGVVTQIGQTIENVIRGLISLGLSSIKWFFSMVDEVSEAVKKSSEYGKQIAEVKSLLADVRAATYAAFAPLVSAALPYIRLVVSWLVEMLNLLARVLAYLTGQKTVMQYVAGSAEAAANSTGKMEKAAKGALAAFDKIDVLPQAKGGGAGAGGGNLEFKVVPVLPKEGLSPIEELWQKIKDGAAQAWEWVKQKTIEFIAWLPTGVALLNQVIFAGITALLVWIAQQMAQIATDFVIDFILFWIRLNGIVTTWIRDFIANWIIFWEDVRATVLAWIAGFLANWIEFWLNVRTAVVSWIAGFLADWIAFWLNARETVAGWISTFITNWVTFWENVWANVILFILNFVQRWGEFWTGVWNVVQAAWGVILALWGTLVGWFQANVIDPIVRVFTTFGTTIKGIWDSAWAVLSGAWLAISGWFQTNVINPIVGIFTTFGTTLKSKWDSAWAILSGAWLTISSWFQTNVLDKIGSLFDTWGGIIKGKFDAAFAGLSTAAKSGINAVIGFINSMVKAIVSGINKFIDALNVIGAKLPFGMKFYITPVVQPAGIPLLAQGAVIPPNAAFTAVLGDQRAGKNLEAPESLIRQIVREESGKNQGSVVVDFRGTIGEFIRQLQPYIVKEQARNGISLILGENP